VEVFLEAIAPAGQEALKRMQEQWQADNHALGHSWALQVEKAEYEAQRAERQFQAVEPENRRHTPFALGYRGDEPPAGSFAQLDAAVYGLWQVRDDCHMAAWRASGLSGPEVEVLTRVWREEAADEAALADLLTHQRPQDMSAAVTRLRTDDLVERDALKTTAKGASARQKIEDDTDRLFFTPWPDDVGAKSAWIAEKLIGVNTALG